MAIALTLLALCILAEVIRELCFKLAADPLDRAVAIRNWVGAAAIPLLWVGISLWVVETFLWIAALQHVPLGVGYPIRAASYALIPLMGWLLLKERLGRSQIAGVMLVTAGVACIGFSGF
jgi:undecaprenyl phosphate-alpha-L-ara4N flippase subunit ArnE